LTWSSVAISSLAFGLLHEQWLAGTLAGAAYAWATTRRGRLSDAVVAHAITNLCLSVQVLGWHQWSLWN
jgi:CAAX prenyl protease-like protein